MRWGRKRHEFLRPVQWLVLLYGAEVINVSLFGLASDRVSRGHRFHGQSSVTIPNADAYEATLKGEFVIASVDERKALIKDQVEGLVSKNERVVIDDSLLGEVTGLVEWPWPCAAVSMSRSSPCTTSAFHQCRTPKYFHIERPDGELVPALLPSQHRK